MGDGGPFYDTGLRIEDSSNITVRDVGTQAFSGVGVEVVQDDGVCKDIRLEGLTTHATGTFAPPVFDPPAPGVNVIGAREVDIVGCRVTTTRASAPRRRASSSSPTSTSRAT